MPAASKSFDVSSPVALALPVSLTVGAERCSPLLKMATLALLKDGKARSLLEGLPKQPPENKQTPDE
jgi:hypothetical protein